MSGSNSSFLLPPSSFPPFRPHPLFRSGHAQTIAGAYLPGGKLEYRATQHLVKLADGDAIVLHEDSPEARPRKAVVRGTQDAFAEDGRIALLVHGLGGSHLSGYMQRTAAKLVARGVRVLRMDLRGYGLGFPHARHPVHAGRSDDVVAALTWIGERYPGQSVSAVGYSMGANMVLRMAGQFGADAPANLANVLAVSPPIDLAHCSDGMQRGLNRWYDRRFVRNLLEHVGRRRREIPDVLDRILDPPPRRLVDFDDQFTAPLCGFADVHDYYAQASSGPLLPRIAVPALIVTAADDPIVCARMFEKASYSPTTQLIVTPGGGHLGFIGVGGLDPDRRWLDWRTVEWVLQARESRKLILNAEPPAHPARLIIAPK